MKRKTTVYIVDDDRAIIRALKKLAEVIGLGAEGYESAEAFLEGYQPECPGCLILDMSLPGMSGLELQAELKNRSLDLPIVFITGHGAEHIRAQAMSNGAIAVLDKPCRFAQLSQAIQKALESVGRA